jgi:glycosyltransferase involved in cell wall biosynthesis
VTGQRIRVLYLSHAFHVGGAEEMVLNLVRRLPERFEPHVCCIHSAGPIGEEIQRTGVPFTVLGLTPGIRRPFDVLRLREHLVRTAPTIVHTFLLTASLYGRCAAILARVPIVIGTEVNIYERKRRHHIAAERLLMAGTDHVVVSANSVRDFYIEQVQAPPERVSVIYNAVDWSQLDATATRAELLASLGVPPDAVVVTIIARLTEQKAHRVLFDALATTSGLEHTHLLVVGGGELAGELPRRAVEQHIASRVHFLGARRDLGNLVGATDVFVMPSLWEGLPLSMVLAMGAGLPVVATRVAGIPEVVRHNETGLLVEPGQSQPLGAALAALVADADLRRRLGSAARDYVRPRFGADKYVQSVVDLYDRLLAAEGRA